MRSRKRKALWAAGIFFLLVLLGILAIPFWLPWVLGPALAPFSVTFASYQREGYSALHLREVRWEKNAKKFEAGTVRVMTPLAWLWSLPEKPRPEFAAVTNWTLTLDKNPRPTRPPVTPSETVRKIESIAGQLRSWAPRARLVNGKVVIRGYAIQLPAAVWEDGALAGTVASEALGQSAAVKIAPANDGWQITADIQPAELQTELAVAQAGENVSARGLLRWQTNRLEVAAGFGSQGWIPQTAEARADSFRIPRSALPAPVVEYIAGSFAAGWTNGSFAVDFKASSETAGLNGPVQILLQASGTTQAVHIAKAAVDAPWLKVETQENVRVSFQKPFVEQPVRLLVLLNLDAQEQQPLGGVLRGEMLAAPRGGGYPEIAFDAAGERLRYQSNEVTSAAAKGKLAWPLLQVEEASFAIASNFTVRASAQADLAQKTVETALISVSGPIASNLFSGKIAADEAVVKAELKGPLTNLAHSGSAEMKNVRLRGLNPLHAQLEWRGAAQKIEQAKLVATAGEGQLTFEGQGELQEKTVRLNGQTLTLSRARDALLQLRQPFAISLRPPEEQGERVEADIEDFDWAGPGGELQASGKIQWPEAGDIALAAKSIRASLFQDFVAKAAPAAELQSLAFSGRWTNSPAAFSLALEGQFQAASNMVFQARLEAASDGKATRISNLTVADKTGAVIAGEGLLPAVIEPANLMDMAQLRTNQPIDFRASTRPNEAFWSSVTQWTGLALQEPSVDLALAGTWQAPTATLQARAASVKAERLKLKVPQLQSLVIDAALDRHEILVKQFSGSVLEQPVTMAARLPLSRTLGGSPREWIRWNDAEGGVRVENAEVARFAEYLPPEMAPQGTVNIDLAFKPGPKLEGELVLSNLATRPLPPVGSLQEANIHLVFRGNEAQLKKVEARVGGEPVRVTGRIHLSDQNLLSGLPLVDLKLTGTNIPLARQPDLILRSDLNLSVTNSATNAAVIAGTVVLRDSFFLSDLKPLMPGRIHEPKRRPPFFSIDAPLLADCGLNVQVQGDRFLKVRSPFFLGEVSTRLKVEGTLKEPVALGEASINTGLIQFPFATLRVTQGLASLTSENPYRPEIFARATGRNFGYDLQMEISGPADEPVIEFSSTPALSSEQIVLMLTTGALPRSDFSFSNEQKAGRLALFFGKTVLSKLGGGGGGDRLTIRSGENISEQGKQTYYIEYKLDERWSLVGEYDRFSAVNAGIKWKIYSR